MTGGDVGTAGEVQNPERPSLSTFVPQAPDFDKVG